MCQYLFLTHFQKIIYNESVKNTPLETMYMEYANTVKHFLISLCGNFDLAEDLTQETFYQAYKSVSVITETVKFRSGYVRLQNTYILII